MIAKTNENSSPEQDRLDQIRQVVDALSEQEKLLVICNYELYGGQWELLRADLADRLEGRPYVFKLGERIKEDLERVHRLQELEEKLEIKLCEYVKLD